MSQRSGAGAEGSSGFELAIGLALLPTAAAGKCRHLEMTGASNIPSTTIEQRRNHETNTGLLVPSAV